MIKNSNPIKKSDLIKKKLTRMIGIAYLFLGLTILFASFRQITGFAISESVSGEIGGFLGFAFLIIGILVLADSKKKT